MLPESVTRDASPNRSSQLPRWHYLAGGAATPQLALTLVPYSRDQDICSFAQHLTRRQIAVIIPSNSGFGRSWPCAKSRSQRSLCLGSVRRQSQFVNWVRARLDSDIICNLTLHWEQMKELLLKMILQGLSHSLFASHAPTIARACAAVCDVIPFGDS